MATTLKAKTWAGSRPPITEGEIPPEEILYRLEQEALDHGISPEELAEIRMIGSCPLQIQQRITELRCWLAQKQHCTSSAPI